MAQPLAPALVAAIEASTLERARDPRGFDAIVVGAGAAGGMAAMHLTRAGMRVLVLDAGWRARLWRAPFRRLAAGIIGMVADPRLQSALPPRVVRLGRRALRPGGKAHQPARARRLARLLASEAFVDGRDRPYIVEPGSRFDWFRMWQIGGRMVVAGHGQQYYRLGERDLEPTDGLSPRWPLDRGGLDAWYDLVEGLLGLSGGTEACPWIAASRVARVLTPSPAEAEVAARVTARWPDARPILGRSAPPLDSMAAAAETGLLTCRTGAIVRDVTIDARGRTTGVRWHDRAGGGLHGARAPTVFLCASTLETTRILLSSGSGACPDGIGARSGALGRYLMDHVVLSAEGTGGALPGGPEPYAPGRCVYLPRFDLRDGSAAGWRGYGVQIYRWSLAGGSSYFNAGSFAEMTPRPGNRVVLDPTRRDRWGMPVLRIACRHDDAELAAAQDQTAALRDLAALFGVNLHRLDTAPAAPGTAIHECGTARMGESPEDSVLDPDNQCWDVKGLYVTDAAAFPSQGAQNPTLTILALTARACDHAVRQAGGARVVPSPPRLDGGDVRRPTAA